MSLNQIQFTPEVLARIAPDVSLQRHLSVGIRPNLRKFQEFNQVEIATSTLNDLSNRVVGSSIIKSGATTLINTITLGIVERDESTYTSIYPVIEVVRGRVGAPSDEEMILSQQLHETILHTKVLPTSSLNFDLGTLSDSISYEDSTQNYRFVLLSHIKIFSKISTLNDLCYISTIEALKSVKLPRVYINDTPSTKIAVRSRNSTKRGLVGSNSDFNLDLSELSKLKITNIATPSNFGVINNEGNNILLVDLSGEEEESTILSKLSIITNGEKLKKVSLINGDEESDISLDMIKKSIELAKSRANNGIN